MPHGGTGALPCPLTHAPTRHPTPTRLQQVSPTSLPPTRMATMSTSEDPKLDPHQFAQAAANTFKEMKMTSEEQDRWTKALKDPKFQDLFADYVKEISDPKARAENDAYLRQIEAESRVGEIYGQGVEMVDPTPAWCFKLLEKKTKTDRKDKGPKAKDTPETKANPTLRTCFINVCTAEKVPVATVGPDRSWSIPLNLGPQRDDENETDGPFSTHDFVVHPDTVRMAQKNIMFRKMVDETAIEEVEKARGLKLDKGTARPLPNVTYKGTQGHDKPSVLVVKKDAPKAGDRAPSKGGRIAPLNGGPGLGPRPTVASGSGSGPGPGLTSTPNSSTSSSTSTGTSTGTGTTPPPRSLVEEITPSSTSSTSSFDYGKAVKRGSTAAAAAPPKEGQAGWRWPDSTEIVPEHSITHQGELAYSDAWGDARISGMGAGATTGAGRRPANLVVKICVPGAGSASAIDLDVSTRLITAVLPQKYRLELPLPYDVDEDRGGAKFIKTREELVVTLPVRPPQKDELAMTTSNSTRETIVPPRSQMAQSVPMPSMSSGMVEEIVTQTNVGGNQDQEKEKEQEQEQEQEQEKEKEKEKKGGATTATDMTEQVASMVLKEEIKETETQRAWRELHEKQDRERQARATTSAVATAAASASTTVAVAGEAFVAATAFAGHRAGYVFTKGAQGLGYYLDQGPRGGMAPAPAAPMVRGVPRGVGLTPRVEIAAMDELD